MLFAFGEAEQLNDARVLETTHNLDFLEDIRSL